MSNADAIEAAGIVRQLLPHAMFLVQLDSGHQVMAHAAGGMRRNFVRILTGDRVLVELAPGDLGRGRITRKYK